MTIDVTSKFVGHSRNIEGRFQSDTIKLEEKIAAHLTAGHSETTLLPMVFPTGTISDSTAPLYFAQNCLPQKT